MLPTAESNQQATSLLEASGLSLRYGDVQVLRSLNFRVHGGSLVGVLGPSGAGKSSLFKLIAGELPSASGTLRLAGREISGLPLWRRARLGVSYLPQEPSVLFDCTLEENLRTFRALASRCGRVPSRDWLSEFGLEHRATTRVGKLSGGERRRLELIRVLMFEASLYVLDEPFTGIDPSRLQHIGSVLREQLARGAAVLLADHRVGEVLELCDQAWLLIDGELRLQAGPDEFAEHPAVRSRYLQ